MLIDWSGAGFKMKEPEILDPPREVPVAIRDLIEHHNENLGYSEGELMTALAINARDYHRLRSPDEPYLTVVA
jgi:hypothetical protein